MSSTILKNTTSPALKNVLSAVKNLSAEERYLLKLKLKGPDVIKEIRKLEKQLRKKKHQIKKADKEIVEITNSIRQKNHAKNTKMLH